MCKDEILILISIILAICVLTVIVGRLMDLTADEKEHGVGWPVTRFIVLGVSLPLCALLALNDALSEGAVAILSSATGFAFGEEG